MKIKTKDIVYRQDLYPRIEPNQSIIQNQSIKSIKINQSNQPTNQHQSLHQISQINQNQSIKSINQINQAIP